MAKLKFHISMSLDGYVAGPDQGPDDPLGRGGLALHEWVFRTRFFRSMTGQEGGEIGIDHDNALRWHTNIGATIMGRNMFGPVRGPWPDGSWTGWWGDDPPYRHPVFVLTHHPRDPVTMQGGTTFHFVTGGIEPALEQAFAAAAGKDVAVAGGARTAQQYLSAGLVDEMGLHVVPVLLGRGERLFDNLDGGPTGYECAEFVSSPNAAHFSYVRKDGR
jgi:dihydrofolate reductase